MNNSDPNEKQKASKFRQFFLSCKINSYIPSYIFFLMNMLVVQLIIFGCFRLIFLFNNYQKIDPSTFKFLRLVLFYGEGFDIIVCSCILAIPFMLLSIDYFFEINKLWFYKFIKSYLLVLLVLSFLICSADIPFYSFFNTRLTTVALLWKDTPGDVLSFIMQDKSKYPYFLLLIVSSFISIYILFRLQRKFFKQQKVVKRHGKTYKLTVITMTGCLLFFGIRGGFGSEPLTIQSLSYTNHYFINQLSWNPVLSFFDSFKSFSLNYLTQEKALLSASRYLGGDKDFDSPIARPVNFNTPPIRANVVLVLMESMSTDKVGQFGNKDNLTPNLDKLGLEGINFTDFYTNGIHTFNGIYGTLFSFPSIMNEHPMNTPESGDVPFTGLYHTLSENKYQTVYICTNNESFDNVGLFVRKNGCSHIYSMKDFPKNKIVSSWGPPDETLFDFSIEKINELSKNNDPFFATLVTISTHVPYVMPDFTDFKSHVKDKIDQVYEYADWSIGRFMKTCEKQPWFNNTIFVFVADHGINSLSPYLAPISFHHSPMIIYSPGLIKEHQSISKPGLQIDIFPTIMGLLKIPYVNNTFGVDLINNSRPYAYFTHDDKLGCLSDEFYLIVNKDGERFMHKYRQADPVNYISKKTALADSMQTYAMSMLQTAKWMILNKKTGPAVKVSK